MITAERSRSQHSLHFEIILVELRELIEFIFSHVMLSLSMGAANSERSIDK